MMMMIELRDIAKLLLLTRVLASAALVGAVLVGTGSVVASLLL